VLPLAGLAEVEGVDVDGGPAAEAGLKAGDTIVAVDGQPAQELLLPDVRTRFRESPPGTGCGSRCGPERGLARWWWCCGTWCEGP